MKTGYADGENGDAAAENGDAAAENGDAATENGDAAAETGDDQGDDTSPYSAATSYEIAVSYSVIEAIAQEALQTNYDTSAHYELFVSSRLDEFETEYTIGQWWDDHSSMVHMETISIDHDALEIMVADADDVMDILLYLDITLVESPDSSDFIIEYESVAGNDYHSTYVRGVEEIVITNQGEDYLPALNANLESIDNRDYLQPLLG